MWETLVVWVLAAIRLTQIVVARTVIRAVLAVTRTRVVSDDSFCAVLIAGRTSFSYQSEFTLNAPVNWRKKFTSLREDIAGAREYDRRSNLPCTGDPDTCERAGCDPCYEARVVALHRAARYSIHSSTR